MALNGSPPPSRKPSVLMSTDIFRVSSLFSFRSCLFLGTFKWHPKAAVQLKFRRQAGKEGRWQNKRRDSKSFAVNCFAKKRQWIAGGCLLTARLSRPDQQVALEARRKEVMPSGSRSIQFNSTPTHPKVTASLAVPPAPNLARANVHRCCSGCGLLINSSAFFHRRLESRRTSTTGVSYINLCSEKMQGGEQVGFDQRFWMTEFRSM